MNRLSPLNEIHKRAGTPMADVGGWLLADVDNDPDATLNMRDLSGASLIQVEGLEAGTVIADALGMAPDANGAAVSANAAVIGRITPSRYLLIAPPGTDAAVTAQLSDAVDDYFVTVSNQTEGQSGLLLSGNSVRDFLSKACALDLHEDAFPLNSVKISSVAKVRCTIWHLEAGFHLYFGRSYAEYMWTALRKSGREFGL